MKQQLSFGFMAIVLGSSLEFWHPALSQTPDKAIDCSAPQTTYEMNYCAKQEMEATERRLEELNQAILSQESRAQQKRRLKKAQQAWELFREETCEYEAGWYEGGTLSSPTYGACVVRINKQRIKDLELYFKQKQS